MTLDERRELEYRREKARRIKDLMQDLIDKYELDGEGKLIIGGVVSREEVVKDLNELYTAMYIRR